MRKKRGIALITVLLVSVVIFILVMAGLGLTGSNLLFVSSVHRRNQALCAAEAGVYALLAKINNIPTFSGPLTGTLTDGSTYNVTFTATGNQLDILSVGQMSGSVRKVETKVAISADAFLALSSEGIVAGQGLNYVNGVASTLNPINEHGNIHTNSNANPALDSTGNMSVTGLAGAVGTVAGNFTGQSQSHTPPMTLSTLDKTTLLTGTFTNVGALPPSGVISSNTRITTDCNATVPIVLQNGAVLHVQGDGAFSQGITGQGTVVTDGMALVRGSNTFDGSNTKGVLLYSSQDMIVANPTVTFDSSGNAVFQTDPIGTFFAGMPQDAPFILSERLPVGAATGADFFTWYADQSASLSPEFLLWRDGDGTTLNPGLPADIVQWLNGSIPLAPQIQQWAAGG